jgi:diguanylate cyclase (GGDEF)-like protein
LKEKKNVIEIAERIKQCLRSVWQVGMTRFQITSSIGIAFYDPFNLDDKVLCKNADLALYEVKVEGRNNYKIYEDIETG